MEVAVCVICGSLGERDHVVTRGSGGGDEETNIIWLCRIHHTLRHQKGVVWLADKYPAYKKILNGTNPGLYEKHLARRKRTL